MKYIKRGRRNLKGKVAGEHKNRKSDRWEESIDEKNRSCLNNNNRSFQDQAGQISVHFVSQVELGYAKKKGEEV